MATPRRLRLTLYTGGILLMCLGVSTGIRGLRASDQVTLALAGAWLALGFALGLLGDRGSELNVKREELVVVLVVTGVALSLVHTLLLGRGAGLTALGGG